MNPTGFPPVTVEILDEIIRRIVREFHPDKIILFGSYANGKPGPDSDLDLLIIVPGESRPAERSTAVSRLLRPRPFPMDILVLTPEEVQKGVETGNPFVKDVFATGRVIYERC